MKKVFRYEDNRQYWDRRWAEAERDLDTFSDLSIYPIKYADMVMDNPAHRTVELGAGLGRVLKHYHNAGYDIVGMELSKVAVRRLKSENPELDIRVDDVRHLPYDSECFDVVLAFGVYHNMEEGMDQALSEAARCLKPGGRFCISMRPNNLEMNINESYWRWKRRDSRHAGRRFHKWLVSEREFRQLLLNHGLDTDKVYRARNLSLLYRVPWLRDEQATEAERRSGGYRLNALGQALDKALVTLAPYQFCNVLVYIGQKR